MATRNLNKRARTGAKPDAHGHKKSATLQTSITRFTTNARNTTGHKRDTSKRKRKQDTQTPVEARGKRAQRSTQEREDATDTETDTDTEELPATQDAKRQKMDRTGIG